MNELLEIGFLQVGYWKLFDSELSFQIPANEVPGWNLQQANVLYAFLENDVVRYVGKTTRTLQQRMYGYSRPSATQSTNIRVRQAIGDSLRQGSEMRILALPDHGQIRYGAFQLNLAAGLEDSIIKVLNPTWNHGSRDLSVDASSESVPTASNKHFEFTLQPTYYERGFFNVPSAHSDAIGRDGDIILVAVDGREQPISAMINRRANQNGTPRIMGGTDLRDWFQNFATLNSTILIECYSPNEIRLRCSHAASE